MFAYNHNTTIIRKYTYNNIATIMISIKKNNKIENNFRNLLNEIMKMKMIFH
jgi:hypothetical protein